MRSTPIDTGVLNKRLTAQVAGDGTLNAWSGPVKPIVSKTGTGTYNIRIPGARTVFSVIPAANATPPWMITGSGGGPTDNFTVYTMNSTTAASQDIGFNFIAEYR